MGKGSAADRGLARAPTGSAYIPELHPRNLLGDETAKDEVMDEVAEITSSADPTCFYPKTGGHPIRLFAWELGICDAQIHVYL